MSIVVNLPDPAETDACLGGLYSACTASPITNLAVYAGSVENLVFFVPAAGWTSQPHTARSAVSIDGSINSLAISLDGSVSACALTPSDEGSELHIMKPPVSEESIKSVKIFDTLFPIRSVCFASGGRVKTSLVLGTDEGRIFRISIGKKQAGGPTEFKPTVEHGGVKCVSTCPLSNQIAASFCDGMMVLFDAQNGAELESRKILKKNLTPDSLEKFHHVWNPHAKLRLVAIAGLAVPIVLKSSVWATTPIPEFPSSMDGNISTLAWSVDGSMLAGVTAAGTIAVFEYSQITGPVLKIRALASDNTIMSCFWSYDGETHRVNALGLKGVRTAVPKTPETDGILKKELKIKLETLLEAVQIDSGLEEVNMDKDIDASSEASSDTSSDSDLSEKAESVDESPELLREELADLIDAPPKDDVNDDDAESIGGPSEAPMERQARFDRQFSFQPGASSVGSAVRGGIVRRILCWNQFGSVIRIDKQQDASEGGTIEVRLELDDAENKNFRLKDNLHGWTLGSLSDSGLALAVKSKFDVTDKYEDDLVEGKEKDEDELGGGLSKVCFRPFNSWGNQREWIVPLPAKAEVESVAAGSTCLAAIATDSTLRIWSNEGGFLISQFCLAGEVPISISAGGNASMGDLFFAVSCMRSRSTETCMYQTLLVSPNGAKIAPLASGPLPVTAKAGCALCWTGISEDLVPFTCDTLGVVRGLFPYASGPDQSAFLWSPLLNFVADVQKRGEGYWPLFVSEREIWCVPTRPEDEYEPRTAPLPPKLAVPLRTQTNCPESSILIDRLVVQQTRWMISLGASIEEGGKKLENAHDKKLAESFRKLLEAGRLEKALGSAALAFGSMTARLMVRMAAALGMRTLESRLDDLFNPTVEPRKKLVSAESTLFPKKGGSNPQKPPMTVDPAIAVEEKPQPTYSAPAEEEKENKKLQNPFAKKRKGEENELSNKLARNA